MFPGDGSFHTGTLTEHRPDHPPSAGMGAALVKRCFAVPAVFLAAAVAFAAGPALVLPFDAYRNQVWFHGHVNDRGPVWLLFDSAAGGSTISRELTRRFGLGSLQFATGTAGGAGPARIQVPVLRGITFSYEGLRLTPPQVPSIPHEAIDEIFGRRIDGIVGKDLLLRYVAEVDSVARKVYLYEPEGYVYRGKGIVLPIQLAEAPIFEAAVRIPPDRKLTCRLMIDTAVSGALIFTAPFSDEWRLPDAVRSLSERTMPVRGAGVGGPEDNTVGRVESVEMGPFSIARPVVRIAHARGGSLARTDFDALIGMELLRRFRVIFDYSRRRVILEPNGNLAEAMEAEMSGVSLRSVGPALEHIEVAEVHEDTPASSAGLRRGDRIVSIDGHRPGSLWDAQRALMAGPGSVVRLGIQRGEARHEVRLTLRRFV